MELIALNKPFTISKLKTADNINFLQPFTFFSRTDDEISLVCETRYVPEEALEAEHGWRCFKFSGILNFELVGIIAKISSLLAKNNIPVFVVSTYNTDYIFVKDEAYDKATLIFSENEYTVINI